jgi:germination protein M
MASRKIIGKTGCLFWLVILLVIIVIFVYKGKGNFKETFSFFKIEKIKETFGKGLRDEEIAAEEEPGDLSGDFPSGKSPDKSLEEKHVKLEETTDSKAKTMGEKVPTIETPAPEKPQSKSPVTSELKTKRLATSLYFVMISNDSTTVRPVSVTRTITYKDSPITRTIESLLEGPTVAERQKGITSFIPEETKLISAHISDGLLTLNFSKRFEENYTGRDAILLEVSQVLLTSFNFSQVSSLSILIEGNQRRYITGEGIPLKKVYTRQDLADLNI